VNVRVGKEKKKKQRKRDSGKKRCRQKVVPKKQHASNGGFGPKKGGDKGSKKGTFEHPLSRVVAVRERMPEGWARSRRERRGRGKNEMSNEKSA